ncbi:transcriptional regulator [Levilactobacillus namurensis DSM 19117]|uniref:Transcriptional regulator n=1 Tax=Levilactobacillus namurensis DSM 19117 TaxID=1423773 RepID=A0A0R1K040_9LACO|nr:transcriptional regulator [Levilactobacillus namurensis DSM 19117]
MVAVLENDVANFLKKVPIDEMILGIGDVARVTGVSTSQLRYWERKGYIQSSELTEGGNRKFSYKTVIQVKQIKQFLDQGYTLSSAVARARKRGVYAEVLHSFFEQRFIRLTADDHQETIDLGIFDPEPAYHLVAYRQDNSWRFRLDPAK